MNQLDEETFLRMWDTSPPEARALYRRLRKRPAYDDLPMLDLPQPRYFVGRCAHCGDPIVVAPGKMRKYCSQRCNVKAYYQRNRAERIAYVVARRAADPERVNAEQRDYRARNNAVLVANRRDRRRWEKKTA